jgi:hypothetical protein
MNGNALKFNSQSAVFERPRTSSRAEVSMRSEALTRSNINGAAWQASHVRIGASRQVFNTGQFIRSLVFAASGFALVVAISLRPAGVRAYANARHDGATSGPLASRSILHFPR